MIDIDHGLNKNAKVGSYSPPLPTASFATARSVGRALQLPMDNGCSVHSLARPGACGSEKEKVLVTEDQDDNADISNFYQKDSQSK